MEDKNESLPKVNYCIKLLAGNNVVLVEADNYEAEIFTPKIVNGRITFVNIIPNRRCCNISKSNVTNYLNGKMESMPNVQYSEMCPPLANSTPTGVNQVKKCKKMLHNTKSYVSLIDSNLPTPEPVRRAEPAHPRLYEKSMLNLPQAKRLSGFFHNSVEAAPKKFRGLVTSDENVCGMQNSVNASILNSSFTLQRSPPQSPYTGKRCPSNFSFGILRDSIATWQKVLTPVRTYTRNSENTINFRRVEQSAKNNSKSFRLTPTYLVNPTQGPNVTQEIKFKKRKLIIDNKICISPKTFKNQQKKSLKTHIKKSTIPHDLMFHKPRDFLDLIKMSAFDLLTNTSRHICVAAKLKDQFRNRCVNKASSTYNKYKVLSTVPPLQKDEEVFKFGIFSLEAIQSPDDNTM